MKASFSMSLQGPLPGPVLRLVTHGHPAITMQPAMDGRYMTTPMISESSHVFPHLQFGSTNLAARRFDMLQNETRVVHQGLRTCSGIDLNILNCLHSCSWLESIPRK